MKRSLLFFIVAIIVTSVFFFRDELNLKRSQNDYLKDMGLVLIGKVESVTVPRPFNGFGIVRLSIIQTNLPFYDPRKDREFYYCLIKDNQAEVYQFYVDQCEPGDIVKN